MLNKILIATSLVPLIAGCATKSADISATYVSPVQYETYSCRQLGEEASRVSSRAAQAMGVQDEQASSDAGVTAISLILFWPAMFFIDGDKGNATEVARLKGEMEAIEQASIQKSCDIQFR
ncbi:MAG: hypothetical protein COA53_07865 [Rhodobacteraceae bacterium]|nr:MAG: hypothetical protein COA53_07865 [Paracoccaceae bacterium]